MRKLELIAFVHKDASAGRSLVELMRAAGFEATLYDSLEAFRSGSDLETVACVVIDDQLTIRSKSVLLTLLESNIPYILLSVLEEGDARMRAHDLGAAAFFREPVDGEALLDAIRWQLISDVGSKSPK